MDGTLYKGRGKRDQFIKVRASTLEIDVLRRVSREDGYPSLSQFVRTKVGVKEIVDERQRRKGR